MGGGKGMERNW